MEPIDKANAIADGITHFMATYPVICAWIFATLASWGLTALAKFWIKPAPTRQRDLRTLDVGIAVFLAALGMWGHVDWRTMLLAAFAIGPASPFLYWLLASALIWKWPSLKRFLTLGDPTDSDPPPTHDNETETGV